MNAIIEKDCREILHRVNIKEAKKKKILITGANGFLGQHIASTFSIANHELGLGCTIHAVGLNKPKPIIASLLHQYKNIYYDRIDLSKPFNLQGYDYIFHAAGYSQPVKFIQDYNSTISINIDATRHLLNASPNATFVFFSSAEIYGNIPLKLIPVRENFNGNCPLFLPRSVYAQSKRLGESLCASYKRDKKTNIKIVRISHTYGPGLPFDDRHVMSEFIKKALIEKKIRLLDSGKSVKTYGYIADIVAMIIFIAFHGNDFVYNVGGKNNISILDLAKKIAKYCNVEYTIPSNISHFAHIGKDPDFVKLNLTKIKQEMGKFKFMPFSEGLLRTIEWTKQQIT